MTISLTNTGKRFNRDWIFRHLNFQFFAGMAYAVTGPNGSGKSTLLQVIAGALSPSEGKMEYHAKSNEQHSGNPIDADNIYLHFSFAAPYIELIEEMTLLEFLHFHQQFKRLLASPAIPDIISLIGLEKATHKQIRYFSSGMKQRVKLAQAVFSDAPVLLLDEPCTNLDAEGVALYQQLITTYCKNRLIIVSSNDEMEYTFCSEQLNINNYK
ncbi:ABC transporter ATP-binding protein [Agriterribacter sp.]|uniref:ABC transporter ATP-binding protein n=1 Tax=Agriterribacter sp. TaxID=2821509 RepID=UPI002CE93032|nr:ABC transporter ATP-binding protein [Agriterribacter sp.]HRO46138.1 ABC transporter ATP-binding protein [Agriterribacter sp.]HRQ16252.1 ABC transporter ATP-binding protein [Agriterribacter sp.]